MKRNKIILIAIIATATIAIGAGAALAVGSSSPAGISQMENDDGPASGHHDSAAEEEERDSVEDGDDANDRDVPITGPDLDRASAAALEFTNGGRVTETEIEDEESYYEVEVTLDDGSQVDVQLDENFIVVGTD